MIFVRHSPDKNKNPNIIEDKESPKEITNRDWLAKHRVAGGILLLGGNSIAHFRIRVAQSHIRHDLMPSPWSLVGILDGRDGFFSVPLDLRQEASQVPCSNGVVQCRMKDYDDPHKFPNIALLDFTGNTSQIFQHIPTVQRQRSIIDLPSLMLSWLGFVWSAGKRTNPLLEGQGLPSAAFVETVYALAGVELTPGLSSPSSCPDAIWQSARWWTTYYAETAAVGREENASGFPRGHYLIRQPQAAPVAHG